MNAAVVVTVHVILLISGILSGTLLVLNRRYLDIYSSYVRDITGNTVSLDGYSIRPDVSLALHLALLTLAMLIPALTGLALANARRKLKKKDWKIIRGRLRVVHVVLLVVAVAVAGDLVFTEAAYVGDVSAVSCNIHVNRICRCGDNTAQVPLTVCLCKVFRVCYLSMIVLGFISLVISFLDATKMVKFTKCKLSRLGQSSEVISCSTKEQCTQVEDTDSLGSLKESTASPQEHRKIFVVPNLHSPPPSVSSPLYPHPPQERSQSESARQDSTSLASELILITSSSSPYATVSASPYTPEYHNFPQSSTRFAANSQQLSHDS